MPTSENYLLWIYNYIVDYDNFFRELISEDLKNIFKNDYEDDLKELYEILELKTVSRFQHLFDLTNPKLKTTILIDHVIIPLLSAKIVYGNDSNAIGISSFGSEFTNCYMPAPGKQKSYISLVKLILLKYIESSTRAGKQLSNFAYLQRLIITNKKDTNLGIFTPSPLYRIINLYYKHNAGESSFDALAPCDLFEYNLFHISDYLIKDLLTVENILFLKSQVTKALITWTAQQLHPSSSSGTSGLCSYCGHMPVNPRFDGDCSYCFHNSYY
ncbi:hypothetical protein QEN19_002887 [Hanseniaspora menglaensis]